MFKITGIKPPRANTNKEIYRLKSDSAYARKAEKPREGQSDADAFLMTKLTCQLDGDKHLDDCGHNLTTVTTSADIPKFAIAVNADLTWEEGLTYLCHGFSNDSFARNITVAYLTICYKHLYN